MLFHIGGGCGRSGIREFVDDTDEAAFLEREMIKATVLAESSGNLTIFIVICLLQRCLQT